MNAGLVTGRGPSGRAFGGNLWRGNCSRDCGHGTCYMGTTSDGDYCKCDPGFSGSNCRTVVCTGRCPDQWCRIINNKADCYDNHPANCFQKSCSNNQHCVMVGSTPTCQCKTGYSGFPSCNTPNSCSTKHCGVNMHCRMNGSTPVCVCNAGYYPSGSTCIKFNPPSCSTKSCPTNQHCRMVGSTPTCHCNTGYSGSSCTIPTSCSTMVCVGNQNCIMSSGMPTCVCNNGWTGDHCNVHVCNKQCINGSCQHCHSGSSCTIPIGTICDLPCQNDGRCISSISGERCECQPGWTGTLCNQRQIGVTLCIIHYV